MGHVCSLPVYVKPLRPAAIVDSVLSNPLLAAIAKPVGQIGHCGPQPSYQRSTQGTGQRPLAGPVRRTGGRAVEEVYDPPGSPSPAARAF